MRKVDTSLWKSDVTKVYSEDLTNEVLISVGADNRCIVTDVYLSVDDNVGAIEVDFENGDPIARLYSSQFNRFAFNDSKNAGGTGEDVIISGDITTDNELFVKINYVISKGE